MILKDINTPNGLAKFHVLSQLTGMKPFATITLHVSCYLDEATYLAGGNLMYQYRLGMPATNIAGDLSEHAECWLIADDTSPLQGGLITADQSDTLQAAKDRTWVAIKAARAAAEEGNFTHDGGSYQADKVRINGAVQLAVLAKSAGTPFSEAWTLTDNTVRDLDADQVIALGVALGQYVSGLYATGRALRAQIDAAETVDEVTAIGWPA
jgi:hypothetical protein